MKPSVHRNYHRLVTLLTYPFLCPEGVLIQGDGSLLLTYYSLCRKHKGRVHRVLEDLDYLERMGFIYERKFISKGKCSIRIRDNTALCNYYRGIDG